MKFLKIFICYPCTISNFGRVLETEKNSKVYIKNQSPQPRYLHSVPQRDVSGFSRFPANESLRRTGLHLSTSTKSSFYLPAFEISRSCRTASGEKYLSCVKISHKFAQSILAEAINCPFKYSKINFYKFSFLDSGETRRVLIAMDAGHHFLDI